MNSKRRGAAKSHGGSRVSDRKGANGADAMTASAMPDTTRRLEREDSRIRRKDLSRIHCLKKDLGLTEDNYRALLQGLTGKDSSKDMDYKERWRVICEMGKLKGGKGQNRASTAPKKYPGRPAIIPDKEALIGKIEALLTIAGRPWRYAHGIAKKMFGIDLVEWCDPDQLWRIAAALEYDRRRREKKEAQ